MEKELAEHSLMLETARNRAEDYGSPIHVQPSTLGPEAEERPTD